SNQRLQTQNKELHQSEVRFRQLLQGVPYAMIGTNPQGLIHYANPRALSLFNYTQNQLIGSPLINILPKNPNNANEHEYTGIKKDNTPFACEVALTTIETREGLLTLHSIKDITKRKASEHKIIQLSQAVEQSSATIVITDTSGIIQYVNKKFTQTTGYTPAEVIGRNSRILKSGHTTPAEYATLWKTILAGNEWSGELHNKKKNGELYWERALLSPIVDQHGTITNFLAVKEDITQLKQSENEIRLSEQKLREAQSIAKVGSWEWNLETDHIIWSDELYKLFDLKKENQNLQLTQFFDFIHPNDKERVLNSIYTVKSNKAFTADRFRILTTTGQLKHIEARGSQTQNHQGDIIALTGTMQDITELVKLENEKAEIHRNTMLTLETKVAERTREINIQKQIIETKNKDLTDSIIYAQRLQKALYPNIEILKSEFKHSFILNKPCTIVSGDFCWFHKTQHQTIIACVDCTGHGVPGAFMSIIGIEMLNRIVIDRAVTSPSQILELVDQELEKVLPRKKMEVVKDGMDVSICVIDRQNQKIHFAGAHHPAVVVSKKKAQLYKGNRYGLGKYILLVQKQFETQEINYQQGDMLYLFTDGVSDQFGGVRNKKLGLNQFVTMLEQVSTLAAEQQKEELIQQFTTWQGDKDQVDDVMIVGIGL
ncbi:MAG TPA: PAS domain S-box protein, partial [Bacteroidia bacterium]|nr:PAS domain S-box protein [Bacteroidia bacterium]